MDPDNANREGCQEGKRRGVRLGEQIRIGITKKMTTGRVLTWLFHAAPRHGEVSLLMAGMRRWVIAVAMMTPELKYLANLCQYVRDKNGSVQ
jgi:hypothetical protein